MSNINNVKDVFLSDNDIALGTIAWREYLNNLGFSGHSIVTDTKNMLVSRGYWTGDMSSSLMMLYVDDEVVKNFNFVWGTSFTWQESAD